MFRRIQYSIFKNIQSFIFRTIILTVLLTFFIVSLLISNLANVYDKIFTGNVDLSVEVSSPLSDSSYQMDTASQYLSDEKTFVDEYQSLIKGKGITYSDLNVTLNSSHPVIPSKMDGDVISFFSYAMASFDYQNALQLLMSGSSSSVYLDMGLNQIEGVHNANIQNFYQGNLKLFDGRLMSQDEIDQGEMVCVIPFAAGGAWKNGKETKYPETGTDFTFTSYVVKDNQVVDHLSWNLKIVGSYQYAEATQDGWNIHNGKNTIPIFIPYKTMEKIQEEAVAFQEKYDPEYLTEARNDRWGTVNSMEFTFQDTDSLNQFVRTIEASDLYESGSINYISMVDAYGTILSNIYTMTDSFRMIAVVMLVLTVAYSVMLVILNAVYRRKEIAVLQSMGEQKGRINLQFFLEQLLSVVLSALAAVPLSLLITKKYGVYLFTSDMRDDSTTMGKAIWATFLGKHMKLSAEDIENMIFYERSQIIMIAVVLLMIIGISYFMVRIMTNRFHARELLNGEE